MWVYWGIMCRGEYFDVEKKALTGVLPNVGVIKSKIGREM
jgi:hypothetical protein